MKKYLTTLMLYDSAPCAEGVVGLAAIQSHWVDVEQARVDSLLLENSHPRPLFVVYSGQVLDGLDALVPSRADLAAQDLPAEGAIGEWGQGSLVSNLPEVFGLES